MIPLVDTYELLRRRFQAAHGQWRTRGRRLRVDASQPQGGLEHWNFGWSFRDVGLDPDRSLEEQFGGFIESLFDDHMSDLHEGGDRKADRGFERLPVRIEASDEVLRRLTSSRW